LQIPIVASYLRLTGRSRNEVSFLLSIAKYSYLALLIIR
jgi:hypothetical protein